MDGENVMIGGDEFHVETLHSSESDTSINIPTTVGLNRGDLVGKELGAHHRTFKEPVCKREASCDVTTRALYFSLR